MLSAALYYPLLHLALFLLSCYRNGIPKNNKGRRRRRKTKVRRRSGRKEGKRQCGLGMTQRKASFKPITETVPIRVKKEHCVYPPIRIDKISSYLYLIYSRLQLISNPNENKHYRKWLDGWMDVKKFTIIYTIHTSMCMPKQQVVQLLRPR